MDIGFCIDEAHLSGAALDPRAQQVGAVLDAISRTTRTGTSITAAQAAREAS